MADICLYRSPIGIIGIAVENGAVTRIFRANGDELQTVLPLHESCVEQLRDYFDGRLRSFSVSLYLKGTEFQEKVWAELLKIPYGQTRAYAQIAAAVGKPKASRAVGQAVHNNPIPIIVPCHRVISSSGDLGGFAWGCDKKEYLLKTERGQS